MRSRYNVVGLVTLFYVGAFTALICRSQIIGGSPNPGSKLPGGSSPSNPINSNSPATVGSPPQSPSPAAVGSSPSPSNPINSNPPAAVGSPPNTPIAGNLPGFIGGSSPSNSIGANLPGVVVGSSPNTPIGGLPGVVGGSSPKPSLPGFIGGSSPNTPIGGSLSGGGASILPSRSPGASILPSRSPGASILPSRSPGASILPSRSPRPPILPSRSPGASILPSLPKRSPILPPRSPRPSRSPIVAAVPPGNGKLPAKAPSPAPDSNLNDDTLINQLKSKMNKELFNSMTCSQTAELCSSKSGLEALTVMYLNLTGPPPPELGMRDASNTTEFNVKKALSLTPNAIAAYIYLYPLNVSAHYFDTGNVVDLTNVLARQPVQSSALLREQLPNPAALYATTWLDVTAGPVGVTWPADPKGIYWSMPALSAWRSQVATADSHINGTGAGGLLFYGPNYKGQLPPSGFPKNLVPVALDGYTAWIMGRTYINMSDADPQMASFYYSTKYRIVRSKKEAPPKTVYTYMKEAARNFKLGGDYAGVLWYVGASQALQVNPLPSPLPADSGMLPNFTAIGINNKDVLNPLTLSKEQLVALVLGQGVGVQCVAKIAKCLGNVTPTNWKFFQNTGSFSRSYLQRAAVSRAYPASVSSSIAMYYSTQVNASNAALDFTDTNASNVYTITFGGPGSEYPLPPLGDTGYWSLTAYNAETNYLFADVSRTFITQTTPGLVYSSDGSLTITISVNPPASGEANWLPVRPALLKLILRVYGPGEAVSSGVYVPPPVVLASSF